MCTLTDDEKRVRRELNEWYRTMIKNYSSKSDKETQESPQQNTDKKNKSIHLELEPEYISLDHIFSTKRKTRQKTHKEHDDVTNMELNEIFITDEVDELNKSFKKGQSTSLSEIFDKILSTAKKFAAKRDEDSSSEKSENKEVAKKELENFNKPILSNILSGSSNSSYRRIHNRQF